jgi:hypothetical protein
MTEFISIGPYCESSIILKQHNLRLNSYPFDYIFSSLAMITHCINDKFDIFLDKQYYTTGSDDKSTRHTYYCKYLDTPLLLQHNLRHNHYYIPSNGNLFNHHNLLDDNQHNKFKVRCQRLLDLIDNNNKIVFVYYNCYTSDYDDIIDFYNNFSNDNIYVVGIFENSYDKKILYEHKNCKIYQNYDVSFILNSLVLYI